MFSDEAVDPRRDNWQRYRAELEHSIVENADVEFETRSFPKLLDVYTHDFTFYVADPIKLLSLRAFSPFFRGRARSRAHPNHREIQAS